MFFLEVTYGDKKARPDRNDFGGELKTLEKDGLTIFYRSGPMYSFQLDRVHLFALGESTTPVPEHLLDRFSGNLDDLQTLLTFFGSTLYNLVIVDTQRKNIILAGSISCCRPLYYVFDKKRFICSTRIRDLKTAGVKLRPNEKVYPEYCVYRYVLPPNTLYDGIRKLAGGQMLRIDLNKGEVKSEYQWDLRPWINDKSTAESELIEKIDDLLSILVHKKSGSAEKRGILLSGGVDSTLLAAMAKSGDTDVDSMSSSFAFINRDDREDEYALSVAKHLGLNHTIVSSTPEQYLTDLVRAIHAAEEPVHHLQSVMLYRLFKEASQSNYDLLLCGEGADGLFGHDAHMKYYKHRRLIDFGRKSGLHKFFKKTYRVLGMENERLDYFAHNFGKDLSSERHILWTLGRYGDPEVAKQHFGVAERDIFQSRLDLMRKYADLELLDMITVLSLLGEGFETMTIWSKLAEKHQIEIVYPYDHSNVIGHALEIPWSIKLREEKFIIRSLLRKYEIPEEFITRPKLSFGFPVRFWAPKGALFQPLVDMATEMFEPGFLQSLQSEETPKAMVLWNLLNLFLWHKMFIEDARPEDLCAEILDRRRSYQK